MITPVLPACRGYTYFGVMFAVMLISLALTGAAGVSQVQQQRIKEQQLLYIGQQYRNAIASYYEGGPGGVKQYPAKLSDLLRDPRYPNIKRHLRKPWRDPLTLSKNWGLMRTTQGTIVGIYSHGRGMPFKREGFGSVELERALANKNSYTQWKFAYIDAMAPAELAINGRDGDASSKLQTWPSMQ